MDIDFSVRSKFLDDCEAALRVERGRLDAGADVTVDLAEGGYDGRVVVTLRDDDNTSFGTDWVGTDPTRFPARIKAAATALRNCGCVGRFVISHEDGALAIRVV